MYIVRTLHRRIRQDVPVAMWGDIQFDTLSSHHLMVFFVPRNRKTLSISYNIFTDDICLHLLYIIFLTLSVEQKSKV